MKKDRHNGKELRIFRKDGDEITTVCLSKTSGLLIPTAYSRCKVWESSDRDIDWLFRPYMVNGQYENPLHNKKPCRVFEKGGVEVTSTVVSEKSGCTAATAYERCVKWEKNPHLTLDWLYRPVDSRYSKNRTAKPKIKTTTRVVKKSSSTQGDDEYRQQLRKHYGLT